MGLTKPRAAQIFNLDYKQSTRVVTTTNITLTGGAPNLVDGVTLSLGDRVLVTGQSTGSQNGLYYVTTLGSGANGTWSRTSDGNENGEIEAGMIVMVTEGTIYADTQWKLITDDPIVIGTTALTFTQNYMANSISSGNSNVVVNSNANVTISSAGTANVLTISSTGIVVSGTESVTGNITSGNTLTDGLITATGNITGGNLITAGVVTATANITGGNLRTAGAITATGNIQGGNIITAGLVSATGNVTGNYILGNGALLTGVITSSANINNGTSNVTVVSSGGNVTVGIGGTGNVAVFATTGLTVSGVISASGNVTGGNLLTAGLISSTGTITSAANITGGNITTAGLVTATGNIRGGNMLTSGLMSATGVIVSNGGYMRANSQMIVDSYSGSSEGGQISLAWTGVSGLTGQGNGTWNLDVDSSNTFRTFYQNATGTTNVMFTLNSTNQTANFSGNIGASYYYGNGAFLTGLSAGSSNGISNGATSITIPVASGNIAMSVAGQSNTVVINLGSLTMYGTFAGPKTLSANVAVADSVNAVIFGPVVINDGYNITVPSNSTLYTYSGT
jgi:hypothetical protein